MPDTSFQEEEYQGQLNPRVWWKIILHGRRHWTAMVAMVVVASITAGFDICFTLVTKSAIHQVELYGRAAHIWGYGVLYMAMVFGFATCIWGFIRIGAAISTGVSSDIRQAAFVRLQAMSFNYYDRKPVGWLVTRLTGDCDRLSRILSWGVLDLTWGVFLLTGVSVLMVVFNWRLGLLVMVIVPPMVWVSLFFQRRILAASRAVRKTNSNITAAYTEAITGVRTTKTLVREAENLQEFRVLTDRMYTASFRSAIWSAVFMPVIFTLGSVGVSLAIWKGGADVLAQQMSLADLYMFISYASFFFMPIQELSRLFVDLQSAQAAAERIVGVLEAVPDIQDTPEVLSAIEHANLTGPRPGIAIDGMPSRIETIEFRNVSFAYVEGQKVLENFSLRVQAGQTIALVGPTGGGKTTIVGLLCRFYEPTAGEVLLNGLDYRKRSLLWLQSNLGIVLQAPHLFSGTVRENIRYGRLEATDKEVEQAAALAGAHEFIGRLEKGYDTDAGHGGNKLSTGQKQLVSLARAILANPQIFIMDEATSSVDTETERLIQAGIEKMLKGRTSFVIAHRLSTIRSADRIVVIEAGRITEDGTHHELIRNRGHYYALYTNQFAREKEDEILGVGTAVGPETVRPETVGP